MDRITIQGYKSFRDLTLQLRGLNLLIGGNGAGKSNFLSLFELLGNVYDKRLKQYVATIGGVDKLLYQGRKTTSRISLTIGQGQNSYLLSLMESDGKLIVEHEKLGYTSSWGNSSSIDIADYEDEANIKTYSGARRGDYIKEYLSQIRKFHFHDTGRRSPFTNESHVVNDAYHLYEHGENLASVLYAIQKKHPAVYNRIVRVIQSVAPYFSDFFFQTSEAETIRLQWQDKYSATIYGPSDLSDGTIRFIAMATLFMQPRLPRVIIIDEPELGLHPIALQKLASLIKTATRRGTQVIAATQSAELISQFDPEDILTVDQQEDGTAIRRLNAEELADWLDSYTLGDLWKQNIIRGGQTV